MNPKADVLAEALKLPAEERAALAAKLVTSLETAEPSEEVERAWSEELERRIADVDAGSAQLVPWEEVRARIQARLKRRG